MKQPPPAWTTTYLSRLLWLITIAILSGCGTPATIPVSQDNPQTIAVVQHRYPEPAHTAVPTTITTTMIMGDSTTPPAEQTPTITTPAVTHTLTITAAAREIQHPKLFFTAEDISTLQSQARTTHSDIWEPIYDFAQLEQEHLPVSEAEAAGTDYRNYGNQLIAFALVCVITEEPAYCDLTRNHLLAYAGWEHWSASHQRDLDLGHMLFGNALAYDWVYHHLTPDERQTIRESLATWSQRMYEASSEPHNEAWNNWWQKSYIQNHYWIQHSSLGIASLVLLGEDERARTWLEHAQQRLVITHDMLQGIGDGSWHEGISYQDYGLTMLLPFLVNLRDIQGVDLLPHTYLKNYVSWRLYNYLSNGEFILAYGDLNWSSALGPRPYGLLRFAAHEYHHGYAEWLAQQLIAHGGRYANVWGTPWMVFEFLYYDPAIEPRLPAEFDTSKVFPDIEAVIWRTGWDDDALVFGLKSGAFGGRFAFDTFTHEIFPWDAPCEQSGCSFNADHDHGDINSFYLFRQGHWLAPETVGYELYDTSYHNTLLIDGEGQSRATDHSPWKNPETFIGTDGYLEATVTTPGINYVASDATGRYITLSDLHDFTRHVVFVRPHYFIMLDTLNAENPHTYEWICHFPETVFIEDHWIQGRAEDDQILGVAAISPQPVTITAGVDEQPYVRVQTSSPITDTRLVHLLYPTDVEGWDRKPQATVLEDTHVATLVQVSLQDTEQSNPDPAIDNTENRITENRIDDILITHTMTDTTLMTVGPYQYDGQVAVISRHAESDHLERLFISGATVLIDNARNIQLATNLDAHEPLEIHYGEGGEVAIYGTINTAVTLYAPDAERVTVNDTEQPFTRTGDFITFTTTEARF